MFPAIKWRTQYTNIHSATEYIAKVATWFLQLTKLSLKIRPCICYLVVSVKFVEDRKLKERGGVISCHIFMVFGKKGLNEKQFD
jgi:hypothetical protein